MDIDRSSVAVVGQKCSNKFQNISMVQDGEDDPTQLDGRLEHLTGGWKHHDLVSVEHGQLQLQQPDGPAYRQLHHHLLDRQYSHTNSARLHYHCH